FDLNKEIIRIGCFLISNIPLYKRLIRININTDIPVSREQLPTMKQQTKIILIAGIILVVAVAFFYPRLDLFADKDQPAAGSNEASSSAALPVEVVQIKPQKLENNLSVTGNIIPNEAVNLRAEI